MNVNVGDVAVDEKLERLESQLTINGKLVDEDCFDFHSGFAARSSGQSSVAPAPQVAAALEGLVSVAAAAALVGVATSKFVVDVPETWETGTRASCVGGEFAPAGVEEGVGVAAGAAAPGKAASGVLVPAKAACAVPPLVIFAVEEPRALVGGILELRRASLLLSPVRYEPSADCDQRHVRCSVAGLLQEMYQRRKVKIWEGRGLVNPADALRCGWRR